MKNLGLLLLSVCLAIGLLIGCGGGGGASAGGGSTVPVSFFLTDNYRDGYDQVWCTITKIEALATDNTATTLFEDAVGKDVNARRLYNGQSLYAFLNQAEFPANKTINRIRLRLKNSIRTLSTGVNTMTAYSVNGTAVSGSTDKEILLTLASPRTFSSGDDFALDFDLSSFTNSGSVMTPVIREGNRSGIGSSSNHIDEDIKGSVSGLNTAAGTFTLNLAGGKTLSVSYLPTTAIFNSNGTPNPVLANAKVVEVRGYLDPTTTVYMASSIKIKTSGEIEDENKAVGTVTSINVGASTFTIETAWTRGFVPSARTITIFAPSPVSIRTNRGILITKADFFATVAIGNYLEIEGGYTSGTNTLLARKIKFESIRDGKIDPGPGGEAEAQGNPSNLNSTAGTLTLSLTEWEGFPWTADAPMSITTTGTTQYKNLSNTTVSKAAFFAAVGTNQVKVEGTVTGTTMVARELKLKAPILD